MHHVLWGVIVGFLRRACSWVWKLGGTMAVLPLGKKNRLNDDETFFFHTRILPTKDSWLLTLSRKSAAAIPWGCPWCHLIPRSSFLCKKWPDFSIFPVGGPNIHLYSDVKPDFQSAVFWAWGFWLPLVFSASLWSAHLIPHTPIVMLIMGARNTLVLTGMLC